MTDVSDDIFARMKQLASSGGATVAPPAPETLAPPENPTPGGNPHPAASLPIEPTEATPTVNRKPGRPPGAKNKPKAPKVEDANGTFTVNPETATSTFTVNPEPWSLDATVGEAGAPADAVEVDPKVPAIRTLYVNCIPIGRDPAALFSDILAAAKKTLPCDYRLGEDHSFGMGPAKLLEAVGREIEKRPGVSIVIDTCSPEAYICIEMLRSLASEVIIGTR